MGHWVLYLDVPLDEANRHWSALTDAGMVGAAEVDGHAEIYFADRPDDLGLHGRWEHLAGRDWHERWRAGLTPVRAGRWTVTPSWLAGDVVGELVVDPGQAFGTGHHETTTACLEALDATALDGRSVLDVGTGTGVLAIAAALAGATVTAVDTDPLAVEAATANAARNGARITVGLGSTDRAAGRTFDVVVANLDSATLVALATDLRAAVAPAGTLIASGVSNERRDEVRAALEQAGLLVTATPGVEWTLLRAVPVPSETVPTAGNGAVVEVTLDGFAHGGAAVGRLPDGRACFVDYAIPGERVLVRLTETRRRRARATVIEVLDPSPDRVAPPCPLFGPERCGGCSMQHIAVPRQTQLLGSAITEQLRRIGRLDMPGGDIEMIAPHGDDGLGYRNRARFAVTNGGRLAFRRARSHDRIAIDDCPLLTDPARRELAGMATGWRKVSEVGLQVGSAGDAALAITATGRDPRVPSSLPAAVRRSGRRGRSSDRAKVRHVVAGHTFVTSATSFFQASTAAAEVLVDLVRDMTAARPGDHVVDCYAGVGLFSVVLATDGAHVTAFESDAGACDDARTNAAGLDVDVRRADLHTAPQVETTVDAVVLDPPRTGAGPGVTDWIAGLVPSRVTYVSCDPATFARDARALVDHGYRLERVVGVDQFTHTGHVELVSLFRRDP